MAWDTKWHMRAAKEEIMCPGVESGNISLKYGSCNFLGESEGTRECL